MVTLHNFQLKVYNIIHVTFVASVSNSEISSIKMILFTIIYKEAVQ